MGSHARLACLLSVLEVQWPVLSSPIVSPPDGLKNFNLDGYKYRNDLSDESNWVCTDYGPPHVMTNILLTETGSG